MSQVLAKSALRLPPSVRHALIPACVFALLAAFTSVAGASCGDWLAHPNQPAATAPASSETFPVADSSAVTEKSPLRAPCNGPLCRQAPDVPTPPAPANVLVHVNKLLVANGAFIGDPQADRFGRAFDGDAYPADGHSLRIEHPPRA